MNHKLTFLWQFNLKMLFYCSLIYGSCFMWSHRWMSSTLLEKCWKCLLGLLKMCETSCKFQEALKWSAKIGLWCCRVWLLHGNLRLLGFNHFNVSKLTQTTKHIFWNGKQFEALSVKTQRRPEKIIKKVKCFKTGNTSKRLWNN